MKKLQQKYKGAENRAQLNEEMMKLYKEHNVNPASGCFPMLLQFPAFIILYNVIRGITNTVTKGQSIPYPPHVCHQAVCASPRYLSESSKMYKDIVASHGQLNAFGINFADRLLSHHSSIWAAIPYLLLVIGAVGLQYLQMSRLNARNPQAAQANPQAAAMQKYLPLIFGIIYLNVAAILNVYFVVSSAIRIGTQEVLFRRGVVGSPPSPGGSATPSPGKTGGVASPRERALPRAGGTGKAGSGGKTGGGSPARNQAADAETGSDTNGKGEGTSTPAKASSNGSNGKQGTTGNGRRPTTSRPRTGGGRSNKPGSGGSARSGSAARADAGDGETAAPKQHPRSKSKRSRKAR
jgi:YidC/Oxa1 family membrane protein insertase